MEHNKQKKMKLSFWGKLKRAIKFLLALFFIVLVLGSASLIGSFVYFSKALPDPNRLIDRKVAQSTKIYDRTGEHLLYEIHGDENRTIVKLQDIPKHTIDAVVALEDKDFFQKKFGISVGRTLYATANYIWHKMIGSPIIFGGSGITQQLVKNAILSPEKTIQRKIKEWILTVQIEQKFSKDQILQMYLNEIPYGSTTYGIESAAKYYFGKSASQLELAESATLAAIIQRPTYYSPYGSHKEELLKRKNLVLDLMVQQGYISPIQSKESAEKPIEFRRKIEEIKAPHFVFFVREYLTNYYGEKIVEQGGLKVVTTLDYELQTKAEEIINKHMPNIEKHKGNNAALTAIDTATGDILAMVGSRDYFDVERDGNVNVAIRPRQPGSSFKPVVYAAAFLKGYTPETILYDVETVFKTEIGKDYIPHNYNLKEYGPVTIRKALAGSLNIPAVKTIYLAGIDRVLDLAEDFGYTTLHDRSRFGLSLVLGGGEVTLLEHVSAYTAFAGEGIKPYYRSILQIKDQSGKVLEEFTVKKKKVLPKEAAQLITSILSDNEARSFIFGANNLLILPDRAVAAKTGTTNDFRDAWTIGYTAEFAAGVWVGNNDNSKMEKGDGSMVSAPIWNEFMKVALKDKKSGSFSAPPENKAIKQVLKGEPEYRIIEIDKASGKLATEFTPPDYRVKKALRIHHSILHYVKKDDPQGETPAEPEKEDPYYSSWEEGIQKWLAKQKEERLKDPAKSKETVKETICEPVDTTGNKVCQEYEIIFDEPNILEYDDVHTPVNKPNVEMTYPKDNTVIISDEALFTLDAFAARGVASVEYYLGEQLLGTATQAPYSLLYHFSNLADGFYTLKAVAKDDVGNTADKTVTFNLLRNADKRSELAVWMGPSSGASILKSQFPVSLNLYSGRFEEIQQMDIYSSSPSGERFLIGSLSGINSSSFAVSWTEPPQNSGEYQLIPILHMKDGTLIEGAALNVSIVE